MGAAPKYLFSTPLQLQPDPVSDKVPRRYTKEFRTESARLGDEGQEFLLATIIGRPSVISSRNFVRAVSRSGDARRVAVFSPDLDSGMMKALASEGIAYVKDGENVYLPFLGMAASPVAERRAPKPLSPHAQRIVLNVIAGRWDGLTAGELAEKAGVSRATVSHCLAEIEAIAPSALSTEWKRKVLRNPWRTKEEMLDVFEPYLISPVRGRKLLKGRDSLGLLKEHGALLSGEGALAFYSDLAYDGKVVRVALHYRQITDLKDAMGDKWVEAEWFDEPDVIVEEWAYVPDRPNEASVPATGFASLDALGLYAEMKDVNEDDVRLADAVAQLREAACRE